MQGLFGAIRERVSAAEPTVPTFPGWQRASTLFAASDASDRHRGCPDHFPLHVVRSSTSLDRTSNKTSSAHRLGKVHSISITQDLPFGTRFRCGHAVALRRHGGGANGRGPDAGHRDKFGGQLGSPGAIAEPNSFQAKRSRCSTFVQIPGEL